MARPSWLAVSFATTFCEHNPMLYDMARRANECVVLNATDRARLATRPIATASAAMAKTIGMVVVAALAASDAGVLAGVAITATRRRIRSAAKSGSRSY